MNSMHGCDFTCSECLQYPYFCTKCKSSYNLNELNVQIGNNIISMKICLKSCERGKFLNKNMICELCNPKCGDCYQKNTNCTACNNAFFLIINDQNQEGNCLENCPLGFYGNTINNKCEKCDIACLECFGEGSNRCFVCSQEEGLVGTEQCREQRSKYYKIGQFSCLRSCCGDGILAHEGNEQCDDYNLNNLDGCNDQCQIEKGWYCKQIDDQKQLLLPLIPSKCFTKCKDGKKVGPQFGGKEMCDSEDIGCDENCQILEGFKCFGGSPSSRDSCVFLCDPLTCDMCKTVYQKNQESDSQIPQDKGICIKCKNQQFLLYDNKCVQQCPEGYFGDLISKYCVKQCNDGFYKINQVCIDKCEADQIKFQDKCLNQCENANVDSIYQTTRVLWLVQNQNADFLGKVGLQYENNTRFSSRNLQGLLKVLKVYVNINKIVKIIEMLLFIAIVKYQAVKPQDFKDVETQIIQIKANFKLDNLKIIDKPTIMKLPRLRNEEPVDINILKEPYKCLNYNEKQPEKWENINCVFEQETLYYIICKCQILEGYFVAMDIEEKQGSVSSKEKLKADNNMKKQN
ncbi:zinc finger lsd1 subclass family protein, putative [Ichthyophthirius multifiliis]|uniref:Zinc finger lsd1 subclass family protein, putative n=1 Tax=Ichthyophthirius multifiliis TaxID=5932 RepID=G0QZN6_ICHMU|nr:zinc finger lsd1 subclass family protein, putative [Ichthyophthirius multifiliis]EGR29310.1 zinc finger lsd1 subclass family protein, putative [Ichthyophthirius multifiliis]|eukprot:XP_004030546.1 zinc finger lsd1 subclass family protein, putative [Ichthyophthirius multifiliis]